MVETNSIGNKDALIVIMMMIIVFTAVFLWIEGPSIKYVTVILANFDPSPLSHCVTHPGNPPGLHAESTSHISDPTPIFSRSSTKISEKAPVQILSQLFAEVFVREALSGCLLSGRFCTGWFLYVPPSVTIHLLQQKVKYHFKF